MKRLNGIMAIAVIFMAANIGYCGTIDAPYEVGTWQGFCTAAVTYTFDDYTSNQYPVAIPIFNGFDFDLTLYPVPNWSPNWTTIQNAAAAGHEVGSHTMSHTNLSGMSSEDQIYEYSTSQSTINSYIPGEQCLTIAYPYCNAGTQSLIDDYYIAGRTCSGQIVPSTPSNFYTISSIICGSTGVNSTSGFISKFTSAASSNGWCVFLLHGIDGDGGYSPLSSTILEESLEYLDEHRDTYWVSTFSNVVRYIKERNDVSVAESSSSGNSITLQVTDTLDDTIYTYPVTIRRPLPDGWGNAAVSQSAQPVDSSIVEASSVDYIMFDAVPDGGDVVITKLPAAPADLTATAGYAIVGLDWDDVNDIDLAGYNIYRSVTSGSSYSILNSTLLSSSYYEDVNIPLDTTYFYVVTAVDINTGQSAYSNEVFGGLYGDFTGDGTVDVEDLPDFLNFWAEGDCNETIGVDLTEDCLVNLCEFTVLAKNWLNNGFYPVP